MSLTFLSSTPRSTVRVGGVGPLGAKVILLAEALGKEEVALGEPLIGAAGQFLFAGRDWTGQTKFPGLNELGLERSSLRLENVIELRPVDNSLLNLTPAAVRKWQANWWERATRLTGANVIVPMGNLALNTVRRSPLPLTKAGKWRTKTVNGEKQIDWRDKITNWRGSFFNITMPNGAKLKAIPTFHPAYVLRNGNAFDVWMEDWLKIASDAHFPDLRLDPDPEHFTDPTEADGRDFLAAVERAWRRNPDNALLVFDIELIGRKFIDLIGFSLDANLGFVFDMRKGWSWRLVSLLLRHPIKKGSHYGIFDCYVLRRLKGLQIANSLYWDSQLTSHCRDPRDQHKLGYVASRRLRAAFWKTERDKEDEETLQVKDPAKRKRYCLAATTRILTAGCRWVPLSTVRIGQKVMAVDEQGGEQKIGQRARKWRIARVTDVIRSRRPVVRITMVSGRELLITDDHQVLAGRGVKFWQEVGKLHATSKRPSSLNCAVTPWEIPEDDDFRRGWMGGFLDGEGCLSRIRGSRRFSSVARIAYAQLPGPVLRRADRICREYRFRLRHSYPTLRHSTVSTFVKGGITETLRILGLFRPLRLLRNFKKVVESGMVRAVCLKPDQVARVEKVGTVEVIDLTTTTATFIAEGYVVHNCSKDATGTRRIIEIDVEHLREEKLLDVYAHDYRELSRACVDLSLAGFRVDERARRLMHARELATLVQIKAKLDAAVGFDLFGKGGGFSPPRVARFFYDTLHCKPFVQRGRPTKRSTDELSLRRLMRRAKKARPVATAILAYRQHAKIAQELRAAVVDDDGRMRSRFSPTAKTARLRAAKTPLGSGVNLQNRCRHSDLRRMFVPDEGQFLLSLDEAQAEDRMVDGMSGVPEMLAEVSSTAIDRHVRNATYVYDISYEKLLKLYKAGDVPAGEKRQMGKRYRHGVGYGLGLRPNGTIDGSRMAEVVLVETAGALILDPEECAEKLTLMRERCLSIVPYQEWVIRDMLEQGFLEDSYGWRIHFKGLRLAHDDFKEGFAWHASGEVAKLMNRLGFCVARRKIRSGEWPRTKVVNQGHDSVDLTVPPELAFEVAATLHASLNQKRTYPGAGGQWAMRMPVGIKIGLTWKDQTEFKQLPTEADFRATMRELKGRRRG